MGRLTLRRNDRMNQATTNTINTKPKILLICTGLGGVSRGFETYMNQLATELIAIPDRGFDFTVASGYKNHFTKYAHKKLFAISRNNSWLCRISTNLHTRFHVEQLSISPALALYIFKQKPVAIYLGEYQLYCYLYKFRKLFGLSFSLCLHTGGQAMPGLFHGQRDWVHHITDRFYRDCLDNGIPANRQFVIPHMVQTPISNPPSIQFEAIKKMAKEKRIILSVGSLDEKVKGMITLAKSLQPYSDKVYPVFLGEDSPETKELNKYLKAFFQNNFFVGSVAHDELTQWYKGADLVVSASHKESFGLVLLEALLQGTRVICFPWPSAEWVFDKQAYFFESKEPESMGNSMMKILESGTDEAANKERMSYVEQRFSWPSLCMQYLNMFRKMAIN